MFCMSLGRWGNEDVGHSEFLTAVRQGGKDYFL